MENFITTKSCTNLGAQYNEKTKSVEFRLFSKNATKIQLCIFDTYIDCDPVMILDMEKTQQNIWSTSVKDYILDCKNKPVFYGYRVFGKNWEYCKNYTPGSNVGYIYKFDSDGNRFNPNKLAYDPYSIELSHLPSDVNSAKSGLFRSGGEFHLVENYKYAPKSVYKFSENKNITKAPTRAFCNEVIGEVHIKDLTQLTNMDSKGTYKAAGEFASEIKKLGITMIEFLPINEFDSKQDCGNHWGYMPLGYFSLAKKYAYNKNYGEILNEFRTMIDEFHKNDIKVCMDMVYNHTGEAGLINNNTNDANLLSYALIDNSTYYKVYDNGYYRSNSGCGNDFNANNIGVMDLIIDSLVFWINQGVDAFRFDLAAALLENSCNCEEIYDNINSLAATLKEKLNDKGINVIDDFTKQEQGVVLIAEPWTCGGAKCYHLGNFPSYWAEWNDIYRDTIRKISLQPDKITPYQIKEIFEGTTSRFRGVNKSINYIASHDGFSLVDLNSYTHKDPSTQGGSDWEICGNYNQNEQKRLNGIKKQLAFLFLSHGIPMIQIGDVIGHSKKGNNNSYNLDNEINYLNWEKAYEQNSFENKIMNFTKKLIKFRNENPVFTSSNFIDLLSYRYDNAQVADFNNTGYWHNQNDRFFGVLINAPKNRIYIALSKTDNKINITLPENIENKNWFECINTSLDENTTPNNTIKNEFQLDSQSLVVFMEK